MSVAVSILITPFFFVSHLDLGQGFKKRETSEITFSLTPLARECRDTSRGLGPYIYIKSKIFRNFSLFS